MNTFVKSIVLMLLAADAGSAHDVGLAGGLRAQIAEANELTIPQTCVTNDRPQTKSKSASSTRFRWTYQGVGVCHDQDNLQFEHGGVRNVASTDACAEVCTNNTGDLNNVVMGFNYNCATNNCECLYTEGTITNNDMKYFDYSNRERNMAKARSSVVGSFGDDDWTCFKLVGAEFTGEGLDMLHKTHHFLRSLKK